MSKRRLDKVGRLRRRGDVERIIRILGREDWVQSTVGTLIDLAVPQRREAVLALAALDGPRAREGVMLALGDRDVAVRHAAVDGLSPQLDESTAAALARAVVAWADSASSGLREHVVQILTARRDAGLGVIVADGWAADNERRGLDEQETAILRRLFAVPGGSEAAIAVARRLVSDLDASDEVRQARIAHVLAALGTEGVAPLILALDDPRIRHVAMATLGAIRDRRAVPALLRLLGNDQPAVRVMAANALGAIREPRAAEGLLRATSDQAPAVRDAAQDALDRLGAVGVAVSMAALVRPLIQRLEELE